MDLSRAEPRTANQRRDRLTDNRTAILPDRRDTRMDRFVAASSMSSARRGDGGAEALMRSLGIVKETAGDFQQYAENKFTKDEADNAAQGALDQATDKVDKEKAQRSHGYRNAVALGRTASAWNDSLREFGDEITGVVEQQDQLTLEERQGEVRAQVEQFFENFAVDPETGKLRPMLATSGSMKYLAEQMGAARPQFERAALQRIEERFNQEALGHFGKNILDQALALQPGQWLDLSNSGALLPATITDGERKAAIIQTAKAAMEALKRAGRPEDGWRIHLQLLGADPVAPADDLSALQSGIATIDLPPSAAAPKGAQGAPKAPAGFDMASYMASTRGAESRGDDTAQATTSSAYGRYQFTKGTWLGLYRAEYGNTGETDAQILAKRAKGDVQDKLMERLTRNNLNALKRAGIEGNAANAYLAHFLGPKDAIRVLRAAPGTPIEQVVSADSIAANRSVFNKAGTAGELVAWSGRKQGASSGSGGAITPDDPVVANPNFRPPDDPADPIELAEIEFSRSSPPSPLLTGNLMLTPEERVALTEAGQQYANEVRSDWRRDKRDGEDRNFDILGLRLLGQGERLTSKDVMDAVDRGDIRMEQARPLMEALRQNAAMAERYADEQEADADRSRAKGQTEQAERMVSHYMGPVYAGRETPAQARARALRDVGRITDPAVRAAVLAAVGEEANRIESLRTDSAPFRRTMKRIDDDEVTVLGDVKSAKTQALLRNRLDVARKRIAERIADGEDPDAAYAEEMRKVAAEKVRLAPRRPAPTK